ncbi:MAG: biotin/lipoyl-binding protein, partial [Bacteroidaceae bacterium]|nr:biotin/lipoyl-binding protein [Bacteroidaceae bacterium]
MKKAILIFAALTAVAACRKESAKAPTEALPVAVAYPETREITLTREYPGYLEADATVAIVGRVNGTLLKSNYTAGQRVKKGDILFVIEPTMYIDAVIQAQSALQTAKADLEYAENNYKRMQAAIERNAVSRIELLQSETKVATCKA